MQWVWLLVGLLVSLILVVGVQSFVVLRWGVFDGVGWVFVVFAFCGCRVGASRLIYGLGVVRLMLVWLVGSCCFGLVGFGMVGVVLCGGWVLVECVLLLWVLGAT